MKEEIIVKDINGPLFFGSTSDFQIMAKKIPKTTSAVIMKMEDVSYMDQSGVFAMEDVLIELCKNDIIILLVNVPEQPKYMMERIDIIPDLIPEEQIFSSENECLLWIKNNVKDTVN